MILLGSPGAMPKAGMNKRLQRNPARKARRHDEPGATPQGRGLRSTASAESAIHSGRFLGDHGSMPQSLSKVILHIIFSTKNREPWIDLRVRPRMHAYLATICRDLGAQAFRVDGVADHVHIVTTLPRTLSQAQMVEEVKKTSSKWIKTLEPRYRGFFWQRGYGAFSVSVSQLDAVLQYLQTQEEHHRTRTFQEEYRELLRRHGMEFDERHVWD
jgi:REP element-mobilizing transposase RayT